MQDIHSVTSGGGAGRFFGDGGGGDRRLRINNNHHQPLKCPRCESPNTKFCYYNNYNLSQPRHFCKGCRRYWTKGGVLRNVPVGGGCRKPKKSSKSKSTSVSDVAAVAEEITPSTPPQRRKLSSSQNSSTESSGLTVTTTATPPSATGSGTSLNSASAWLFNIPAPRNPNPSFDLPRPPLMTSAGRGVPPAVGAFASLMTSPDVFAAAGMTSYHPNPVAEDTNLEQKWMDESSAMKLLPNLCAGFLDQSTDEIELPGWRDGAGNVEDGNSIRNHVLGGVIDWGNGNGENDEGIFDWTQTQWPDHDHQLTYLP